MAFFFLICNMYIYECEASYAFQSGAKFIAHQFSKLFRCLVADFHPCLSYACHEGLWRIEAHRLGIVVREALGQLLPERFGCVIGIGTGAEALPSPEPITFVSSQWPANGHWALVQAFQYLLHVLIKHNQLSKM